MKRYRADPTITGSRHGKTALLYFITLLLGITAFIYLQTVLSQSGSTQSLLRFPWFLAASGVFFLIQVVLNPFFSILALKSIRQKSLYSHQLLISIFATSANSTVPVPAGIPIRAYLQKKMIGIPYSASASAIIIETVTGYGITISSSLIMGYLCFGDAIISSPPVQEHFTMIVTVIFFSIGIMCFLLGQKLRKRGGIKFVTSALRGVRNAESVSVIAMVGVFILSVILALGRIFFILQALDITLPLIPLLAAMLVARMAGVLSFIPMGLGIKDASLSSLLILMGTPPPVALAAAILDRLITVLPYLAGGVISSHLIGKQFLRSDSCDSSDEQKSTDE